MNESFNDLIQKIKTDLPNLITPDMLVKLGLCDHVRLHRIRQTGELPFLKLSNARILFMKDDVIQWLTKAYRDEKKEPTCLII